MVSFGHHLTDPWPGGDCALVVAVARRSSVGTRKKMKWQRESGECAPGSRSSYNGSTPDPPPSRVFGKPRLPHLIPSEFFVRHWAVNWAYRIRMRSCVSRGLQRQNVCQAVFRRNFWIFMARYFFGLYYFSQLSCGRVQHLKITTLDPGTTRLLHLVPGSGTKWAHFTLR